MATAFIHQGQLGVNRFQDFVHSLLVPGTELNNTLPVVISVPLKRFSNFILAWHDLLTRLGVGGGGEEDSKLPGGGSCGAFLAKMGGW